MWKLSEPTQASLQQLHDLLSTTRWFGKAKREQAIVALLDRIASQGEPAAVSSAARCLFESSREIRSAASRTIDRLLAVVAPDQLLHLSGVVGSSWVWSCTRAWDTLSAREIPALLADLDCPLAVLGLLSFHRSGYVRQQAVRLLSRERSGDELPYLLIRANDWVSVVAEEASAAIGQRLAPDYLPHFARRLPLVVRLLAFRRRDLSPVVRRVVETLVQPEHDAVFDEVLNSADTAVRRQVISIALETAGEHRARVVRRGLLAEDAIVRLRCARRVGDTLSGPELREATARLQRDRFLPVRREGFRLDAESNPDQAVSIWTRALLDRHPSMRALARHSLDKRGWVQAAAFYRQEIKENGDSLPAVAGLAECRDQTDLAGLRALLTHKQPRLRRIAVCGMARIAREAAVDVLVGMLRDPSPSVAREAKRRLEEFLGDVRSESLFAVVKESESDHSRRCAVQLIVDQGKWRSLPWLIQIAYQAEAPIASMARRSIEAWFTPPLCNKVFTRPLATERQAIDEAMRGVLAQQQDAFFTRLCDWLRAV